MTFVKNNALELLTFLDTPAASNFFREIQTLSEKDSQLLIEAFNAVMQSRQQAFVNHTQVP